MPVISLDQLRANPAAIRDSQVRHAPKARAHPKGRYFLKGPIPIEWVAAVCSSGHPQALLVAELLVVQRARTRKDLMPLPFDLLAQCGVDRWVRARALVALEQAGVVELVRHRGAPPEVKLLLLPASRG